jgi:hypothetical protein
MSAISCYTPNPKYRYFTDARGEFPSWSNSAYLRIGIETESGPVVLKIGEDSEAIWSLENCLSYVEKGHWREITAEEAALLITE